MQAYAPLSWKVFGSAHLQLPHKLMLMRCLLMSKLLFSVEVLIPAPRHPRRLNSEYMAILRRIADEPRFHRTEHTDREIRDKPGQPAIECAIARMRLRYLRRVAVNRPRALVALLHARPRGQPLRWLAAVARDCKLLRPSLPADFLAFLQGPSAW